MKAMGGIEGGSEYREKFNEEIRGERADYLAVNDLITPYGHKSKESRHLGEGRDPVDHQQVKNLVTKKR